MMKEQYINPFTDFGFKKLFGEEASKDLLIDFLNELLPDKGNIVHLSFLKNENLGATNMDRKAIYDLYCQNENGEKFIVELQKAHQKYFRDRSIYYSTFAIQEQAKKGDWDYQLQGVYTISVMDFIFGVSSTDQNKMRHDIKLMDIQSKEVFYEKLHFIYLEMPKFVKTIDELETHFDKWLFLIQNLSKLDEIPEKLKDKIFLRLFEIAKIANYNEQEQRAYQDSLKYYRDWKNVMNTAIEEAVDKKMLEMAIQMKVMNYPLMDIAKLTNLSIDFLEKL